MRKKLNTHGRDIKSYAVDINSFFSQPSQEYYQKITLSIFSDSREYIYDIHQDTRHPDLNNIKYFLEDSLKKAIQENLSVSISEYKERDYIFFEESGVIQQQYTGRRTA